MTMAPILLVFVTIVFYQKALCITNWKCSVFQAFSVDMLMLGLKNAILQCFGGHFGFSAVKNSRRELSRNLFW